MKMPLGREARDTSKGLGHVSVAAPCFVNIRKDLLAYLRHAKCCRMTVHLINFFQSHIRMTVMHAYILHRICDVILDITVVKKDSFCIGKHLSELLNFIVGQLWQCFAPTDIWIPLRPNNKIIFTWRQIHDILLSIQMSDHKGKELHR